MAGAISPIERWFITDNGVVSPGAKLYTYLSGTSTPQAVYNNADLAIGHAHANPVVADSEGMFPVIYLAAVSYRFLVTDSVGATIIPAQDDIYDFAELAAASGTPSTALVVAGETLAVGQSAFLSDGSSARTAGRWYLTDSDDATASSSAPMTGIVLSAGAAAASVLVQVGGRVTGLSALSAGGTYYTSSTAGGVTQTIDANARLIGVADSTTSLVLLPQPATSLTHVTTQTSNYTATIFDGLIIGTGTWTLSLYTASAVYGRQLRVKNNGTGVIMLDGSGSQTIDGVPLMPILPGEFVIITTNGSDWVSSLPNVRHLDQLTTPASITNSVTETSLYLYSLPGNILGTKKVLHLKCFFHVATDAGGDRTVNPRVKFGGTTILSGTVTFTANTTHYCHLDILIFAAGATNAQRAVAFMGAASTSGASSWVSINAVPTVVAGNQTIAIDTTAAANLEITAQLGTAAIGFTASIFDVVLNLE